MDQRPSKENTIITATHNPIVTPMTTHGNNKRIAKNTLMLYGRMMLGMAVSLYTSRVVLVMLGVEDFGIYNVVGGVVVLFSFLNSAMSGATQRFLNFEIGRNNPEQVRRVFSMSLTVHFCIAATVLVLAETVGLWFLNTHLNIPSGRMAAAKWVYQFSVASTVWGILIVPYNALIIAYEKMALYAYLSIAEGLFRLGCVCLLALTSRDKLILFAGLLFCISMAVQTVYIAYCRRSFETAAYKLFYDKVLFRTLMSFSGWSLFGSVAVICNTQGINLLMNIFYGVVANAGMGVANQLSGAIYQFVTNFQIAFSPQIVKYHASGQRDDMLLLIFRASKVSFFLMLLLSLPVIANINFILSVWLKVVPEYSAGFACLVIGCNLLDCLSLPIYAMVNATGNIRSYQVIISTLFILNIPIAYGLLSIGLSPFWVLASRLCISFFLLPARLLIAKKQAELPIQRYVSQVLLRVAHVFLIAIIPTLLLSRSYSGLSAFLVSASYSSISVLLGGWFLGLSQQERAALIAIAEARWKRLKCKGL